jgi:hypothetical protein
MAKSASPKAGKGRVSRSGSGQVTTAAAVSVYNNDPCEDAGSQVKGTVTVIARHAAIDAYIANG